MSLSLLSYTLKYLARPPCYMCTVAVQEKGSNLGLKVFTHTLLHARFQLQTFIFNMIIIFPLWH